MYTDEARHELGLLTNTWLVDEFELSVKKHYNKMAQALPNSKSESALPGTDSLFWSTNTKKDEKGGTRFGDKM